MADEPTVRELPPLEVLKALSDDSRHAIYELLRTSSGPLSTGEVATMLELHPNTVRPHLERLRDAGLVELVIEATGAVGRPQHRYRLAATGAVEPDGAQILLSRLLLEAATHAGVEAEAMVGAGRQQGRHDARERPAGGDTVAALEMQQRRLGFEPEVSRRGARHVVTFQACPFRDLAQSYPELVCGLHCGLVEGLLEERSDCRIEAFHRLDERDPCQVEVATA